MNIDNNCMKFIKIKIFKTLEIILWGLEAFYSLHHNIHLSSE